TLNIDGNLFRIGKASGFAMLRKTNYKFRFTCSEGVPLVDSYTAMRHARAATARARVFPFHAATRLLTGWISQTVAGFMPSGPGLPLAPAVWSPSKCREPVTDTLTGRCGL